MQYRKTYNSTPKYTKLEIVILRSSITGVDIVRDLILVSIPEQYLAYTFLKRLLSCHLFQITNSR